MKFYRVTQNYSPCRGEITAKGRVELYKFHINFIREREFPNEFWTTRLTICMVKNLLEFRWPSDRLENGVICKNAILRMNFFQNSNDHVHGRNLKFNEIHMNLDRVKWNSIYMEIHMNFQNAMN